MRSWWKPLLAVMVVLTMAACSKVPAGNVGVKVNLLGGDKGVDVEELTPGRYWIGINEELYLFPTFTQTYTWAWAKDKDESVCFQTAEGMSVCGDIGVTYTIDPKRATDLFQRFRMGVPEITDGYLRNMVRDALVAAGGKQSVEVVYGQGKTELLAAVQATVSDQVKPWGINIERLYWAGQLRLPQNVTAAINAKIQATQMAQQRENEVAQAKAEADKEVEAARGVAESNLLKARAEADGKLLIAEAEAKGMRLKADALRENQRLVEVMYAERWDGKLPQYQLGGATPFINLK